MISETTLQAIAAELAKVNPTKWEVSADAAVRLASRSQWETDCLAVADALPLTGFDNQYRRQAFLDACGLNQPEPNSFSPGEYLLKHGTLPPK